MPVKSDLELSWWQKVLLRIISCGPKINHLAVVMDGNRRFAQKLQQNPVFGHEKGSWKFFHLLEMARLMGIDEITVYAFSVENFKRPKQEIDEFMQLMSKVLRGMLKNVEEYNSRGIRLRFIGELHMIREECQKLFHLLMEATEGNRDFVCNAAVAYTSRVEITKGIVSVLESFNDEDINEEALEKFFYTHGGKPVDFMIRTSGETRFSDFLTWQSDSAIVHFTSALWPEFGILNFLRAILQYQKSRMSH